MSNGPFYAEGAYMGDVTDVAVGESKNGHPMVTLKFLPVSSVSSYLDDDGQIVASLTPTLKQYERTTRVVIKEDDERSLEFALLKLRTAGWQGESFREIDTLRGESINLTCHHEEGTGQYAGKVFERWELPLPPRESEPLESDTSVARKLDALFGRKLKTEAPKAGAVPVAPTSGIDDDIPFMFLLAPLASAVLGMVY